MAFTISKINRKPASKQQDIKECYFYIMNNDLLTENVKFGIWKYCNYRFSQLNRGKFNKDKIQSMVENLLEEICRKSYINISIEDVQREENEILFHIKRAIFYKATRSLYYKEADFLAEYNSCNNEYEIKKPRHPLSKQEVLLYMEDKMI